MIVTARQIEEMVKSGAPVVLPYRARLTPLAQDLIRLKKIQIGYADVDTKSIASPSGGPSVQPSPSRASGATLLWWCDGPCGPAKAAVMAQAKETSIAELPIGQEQTQLVAAIKALAKEVSEN